MTAAAAPSLDPALHRVRRHVWLLFLLNGVLLSSWAVRIPSVQARWSLTEGQLGGLLFLLMLGNVCALPVVNRALRLWGVRPTALACLLSMALGLALLPSMPSVALTAVALWVFGMGFSGVDLGMNTVGAWLEARIGQPIMSSLHGAYSLGALLGAGLGSAAIAAGLSLSLHLSGLGLLVLLLGGWCVAPLPGRLETTPPPLQPSLTQPRARSPLPPSVVGLLVLAFCAALCEGAVTDWSAVLLQNASSASAGQAGLGFALFSLLMVVGRTLGDPLTVRMGATRLAGLGVGLMTLGFVAVVLFPTPVAGILGFGLSGLGLSVLAPLAFSAAGRSAQPTALATLTAVFYSGYLAGPPVLGVLAQQTSLRAAFVLPVVLGVLFGILALGARLLGPTSLRDEPKEAVV